MLTKLINAEYACYKAEKFAKLEVSMGSWNWEPPPPRISAEPPGKGKAMFRPWP